MAGLPNVSLRKLAASLTVSAAGLAAIALHEGEVPTVYLDPIGIPTVCMGTTEGLTQADVGRYFSPEQCDRRNRASLKTAEDAVRKLVRVPITQGQFDALVSFTFNVGGGALASSTLLRKLNAGDCRGAASEFPRWNKAGGRVLPGLTKRRADEQRVFAGGCR